MSFNENIITIGTGLGSILFYDLNAGKYLECCCGNNCVLHSGAGFLVCLLSLSILHTARSTRRSCHCFICLHRSETTCGETISAAWTITMPYTPTAMMTLDVDSLLREVRYLPACSVITRASGNDNRQMVAALAEH